MQSMKFILNVYSLSEESVQHICKDDWLPLHEYIKKTEKEYWK
jgi:hypothetical protein